MIIVIVPGQSPLHSDRLTSHSSLLLWCLLDQKSSSSCSPPTSDPPPPPPPDWAIPVMLQMSVLTRFQKYQMNFADMPLRIYITDIHKGFFILTIIRSRLHKYQNRGDSLAPIIAKNISNLQESFKSNFCM